MNTTAININDSLLKASDRYPIQRILDTSGEQVADLPDLDDDQLRTLFLHMVRTRTFDESSLKLQRVGRIPAYYPCAGMETHVAVPGAVEDRDWIFCAYREQGILSLWRCWLSWRQEREYLYLH